MAKEYIERGELLKDARHDYRKGKKYTEQEITAIENKAYIQGYNAGKAAGEQEAMMKKYTINDVRAFFGLPSIADNVMARGESV